VLVVGGLGPQFETLASAEIFDPGTLSWSVVPAQLHEARSRHIAALLPDGRVLVAGGRNSSGSMTSVEIFDPATMSFTVTAPMNVARDNFGAEVLEDGRVLVAGGISLDGSPGKVEERSVEIFDPATETWSFADSFHQYRWDTKLARLADGRILTAGGDSAAGHRGIPTAEIYDPAADLWNMAQPMSLARREHTLTTLAGGLRILAVGGNTHPQDALVLTATCELYDANTGNWSVVGSLALARFLHTATLLPDGRVLVVGGRVFTPSFAALASAEIFDPTTGLFSSAGDLAIGRDSHTATALLDGSVLIVGGVDTPVNAVGPVELYRP
jgi:hypothetical protein